MKKPMQKYFAEKNLMQKYFTENTNAKYSLKN